MIFPGAVATMSTPPHAAQASARQKHARMLPPIARPIGDGGVSTISSAAGRNAVSSPPRRTAFGFAKLMIFSADMVGARLDALNARLQAMQLSVAAAAADQFIVRPVLDDTAALDRDDAVSAPHGREPVRDQKYGAPFNDAAHVVLDDPPAFVI